MVTAHFVFVYRSQDSQMAKIFKSSLWNHCICSCDVADNAWNVWTCNCNRYIITKVAS